MKNFKAISMDCNEEQFETIKEELIEFGCNINVCDDMDYYSVLTNNCYGIENSIVNVDKTFKTQRNRTYIGAFDKEAFLQACGKIEEDKKNGWYAYQDTKYLMFHDFEKGEKFGFCTIGDWYKGVGMIYSCYLIEDFIKLDNEEVLKRLTEEAKRRGFKVGYSSGKYLYSITEKDFIFDSDKNNLYVRQKGDAFNLIMQNGIWADIIKNEEPKIESYDVEKQLDKKLDSMTKSRNQYKYLYEKEKKLNKEYANNMIAIRGAVDEKEYEIKMLKNDIDALKNYNETYYNAYKRRMKTSQSHIDILSKNNNELCYENNKLEKELAETRKKTNRYKLAALISTVITSVFIISKLLF